MKRMTCCWALLLGVTVAPMHLLAGEGDGDPRIVADRTLHDFGQVLPGETPTADFALRNDGVGPLIIHDVRASCACTVVDLDHRIEAGDATRLTATLDASNLRGSIEKSIRLFTNDPRNPALTLTLQAEVRPFVDVDPGFVRLVVVRGSAAGGLDTQVLWAGDAADLEVLGVEAGLPFLSTRFREAGGEERRPQETGRQWLVETRIEDNAPVGPFVGELVIRTNHDRQPKVSVPVSGYVQPLLSVTPAMVDFGEVEVEKPVTASLLVKCLAEEGLEPPQLPPGLEGLGARISRAPGGSYYLFLTLNPEVPRGPFQTTVKLRTAPPHSETLEVEVRGVIQ